MAHAHADTYASKAIAERTEYSDGAVAVTLRCGLIRIVMEIEEAAELAAQIANAMMPAETEAAEVPA